MAVETVPSFVDCLRRANLLKLDQLAEVTASLQKRFSESRALARELVRRGWLTPFQGNQVLAGKTDDLTLGSYILLERLGEGGMGQVFKARHAKLDRIVALKLIRKDHIDHPDAVKRFQREIKAASQLSHPNIVHSLDADQAGDLHFLVMEYIEGTDLARLVREKGPLPVAQACDFIRQAASGLAHAHEKGMVHRDIKPANLLVSGRVVSGELSEPLTTHHSPLTTHQIVKIADMGLARCRSSDDSSSKGLTREGSVLGTVDYVAPEQAMDSHAVDIRADLYSLGCTFYFLLTGKVPYPGGEALEKLYRHRYEQPTPVEQLRTDVPASVIAVVAKLLAKQPEARYQTPAELVSALGSLLQAGLPATAISAAPPLPAKAAGRQRIAAAPEAKPVLGTVAVVESTPVLPQHPRRRPTPRRWLRRAVLAGFMLLFCSLVLVFFQARDSGQPSVPMALQRASAATPTRPATTPVATSQRRPDPSTLPQTTSVAEMQIGREVRQFRGHTAAVACVALSPDGKFALSASDDKTIRLWDVQTGRQVRQFNGHADRVQHVALSSDGQRALSTSGRYDGTDRSIRLWDVATGTEIRRFDGHDQPASRGFFTSAGRAVSMGWDSSIRLWDLETGRLRETFAIKPKVMLSCAAILAQGTQALVGGFDKNLRLMDLQTGRELRQFIGHSDRVQDVAVSPDGKQAVSAASDQSIRVWNLESGAEIRTITGHTGPVNRVLYFRDGKRIASASTDKTIRIWEVDSGKELLRCQGHQSTVHWVVASADERHLLSASDDRTLILWAISR